MEGVIATALSLEERKEPRIEYHFADDGEQGCEFVEGTFEHEHFDDFNVVNSVGDFEAEAEQYQTVGGHGQELGWLKEEIHHEKPQKQSGFNQKSTPHKLLFEQYLMCFRLASEAKEWMHSFSEPILIESDFNPAINKIRAWTCPQIPMLSKNAIISKVDQTKHKYGKAK